MRIAIGALVAAGLVSAQAQAVAATAADAQAKATRPAARLVTARSRSADVTDAIEAKLWDIEQLRDGLPKDISRQRTEQVSIDSSIIALSIASVAGALYRASLPAIGGIALAASGLSQYRSYYNPEAKGAGYITAEKSARCVYSTGEQLLAQQPKVLWQSMANLRLAIAEVEATSATLDNATAAGQAGSDAASQALTAANSALNGLTAEATAYNLAPSTIDSAHDAIKDYVDKIEHRTVAPDFGAVSDQLNASITAQATSTGQTAAARAQLLSAYQAQSTAQQAAPGGANIPAPTANAPDSLAAATTGDVESDDTGSGAATPNALTAGGAQQTDAEQVTSVTAEAKAAAAQGPVQAAAVNVSQVTALIKATNQALGHMPSPLYSATNTAISACVAALD